MGDGANIGVKADRALKSILGGEPQPSAEERATPEQVRARLMAAPRIGEAEPSGYGACADMVARAVLEFIEAHPEHRSAPASTSYDMPEAGTFEERWSRRTLVAESLYDIMKREGVDLASLGITGFQWGWAYNCAHYCLGLPPQPNPAILTIG